MPFSYAYDPNKGRITISATGLASMAERKQCVDAILADARLPLTCDVLIDASGASDSAGPADAREIADYIAQLQRRFSRKVALLNTSATPLGTFMVGFLCSPGPAGHAVKPFASATDAEAWLAE